MELNDKIVIYKTADGQTSIDVKLEHDTVWLSQAQMSELFQTDRTSILRHIKNIYETEELEKEPTCAFFAQVRTEGKRTVTRNIPFYNLDMIISVGYRVNSKRGTQFRIWANRILKEYLVRGYAINRALAEQHYTELKQLVGVLGRTIKSQETLTSNEALNLISFSDGNKRIAATLFLWFMAGNGILYNPDGSKRIADNTLVALTLMIAESRTEEKDVMVKVVVNLINKNNYE